MKLPEWRGKLKKGEPKSGLIILTGLAKSGKSTLGASWPDSVVLELEKGGADRISGRIAEVGDLKQFRSVLRAAIEDEKVKTVVVDTIDALSDLLEHEVAEAAGLEDITQRKAGVDGFSVWGAYRSKIEGFVAYARASGKLFLLLAHNKEPKLDSNGTLVSPAGIQIPGKSGLYLAAQADAIGNMYKKPIGGITRYFLSFQGGPLGAYGSRIVELEDKTVELPKDSPYSAFAALFAQPEAKAEMKAKKQEDRVPAGAGRRS